MNLSKDFLHAVTLDVLYVSIALLTFVLIERLLYYSYLLIASRGINNAIQAAMGPDPAHPLPRIAQKNDVISKAMTEYIESQRNTHLSRSRIEDLGAALYLRVEGRVVARLWVLDTIVTAAPLLGLLGTILGIMDTFAALSAGGISDPGAVSRGIGMALFATALGIGTALYGLIGHNALHRMADMITETFKTFVLETTSEDWSALPMPEMKSKAGRDEVAGSAFAGVAPVAAAGGRR